jgi:hypothetical protein
MPKYPQLNPMSIVTQGEASRASGGGPFVYPQLTATNYTSWVIRVQAIMEDQEVWEAVEPATGTAVERRSAGRRGRIFFKYSQKIS